jgi:hypothetical protein
LQSPALSVEGDNFDESGASPSVPVFIEGDRAIEDWLAQAKESFLQFGNSISRSYLSDDDSDSNGWDDDDYEHVGHEDVEGDDGERYGIAVETVEDKSTLSPEAGGQRLKLQDSNSSLNTTATSVAGSTGQPRKKGSGDKASNLPTEAAPWGLMGRLSLAGNPGDENSEDTGITRPGYFTSEQLYFQQLLSSPDRSPDKETEDEHVKNVQRVQPHILSRGVISTSDAEKLFTM